MLFVAEYELRWETLDAAVAKRIEWSEIQPDGFHFVGEYVWQDRDPPFRGIAIIDADSVEALNSFVLHYGPTLKMHVHPASDVATGLEQVGARGTRRPSKGRKGSGVKR